MMGTKKFGSHIKDTLRFLDSTFGSCTTGASEGNDICSWPECDVVGVATESTDRVWKPEGPLGWEATTEL